MMMLIAYIKKRLIGLAAVLIGITFLSFIFANISPIDPAEAYMRRINQNVNEEEIQKFRKEMGYDLPIYKQYFRWVSNAIREDFGESLTTGNSVAEEIASVRPMGMMSLNAYTEEGLSDEVYTKTFGTGKYMIENAVQGEDYTFVRNEN